MKKLFMLIIGLLVVSFMSSCGDKSKSEIERILEEEEKIVKEGANIIEEDETIVSSSARDSDDVSSSISDDSSISSVEQTEPNIASVKSLIVRGKYESAIDESGDARSHEMKYYKGIAYYCMMQMKQRYSQSERIEYRDNAISLLKEVGYDAVSDSLKSRALMWYGMAVHLNYEDLSNKRIALGAFHRIQSTRLKDTKYHNDSLLFTAKVYKQIGWYKQARRFYKKLRDGSFVDEKVYDFDIMKKVSTSQAADDGLEEVRRICYAEGGSSYVEETVAETPLDEETVDETTYETVDEEESFISDDTTEESFGEEEAVEESLDSDEEFVEEESDDFAEETDDTSEEAEEYEEEIIEEAESADLEEIEGF
ncbi:hypothetical protein ACFL6D_01885 [Spirochaetota bacterium]